MPPIRVLFVCTGNICRSPTARAVFEKMIEINGLTDKVQVDSAALEGYHVGQAPDPRSQKHARLRGYDLSQIRARQIRAEDFGSFDHILAMDRHHLQVLLELSPPEHQHKIRLFLQAKGAYSTDEVPDPYYGPADGFERVLDLVEEGLHNLKKNLGI
jgi:protein-tyrosine phosphatase